MSLNEEKIKEYGNFQAYIDSLDADALTGLRAQALARFKELGLPTRKTESWKYVNLLPSLERKYADAAPANVDAVDLGELANADKNAIRIVFVDGRFIASLSTALQFDDITVEKLESHLQSSDAVESRMGLELKSETNPFALLNTASFKEGTFIKIHKNVKVEKPIHIYYVNQDPQAVFATRTWLVVEENAEVDIMCSYLSGKDGHAFSNDLCEIELRQNARVNWVNVQNMDGASTFISSTRVYLDKDAHFERVGFSSGGNIIRNDERCELLGENAFCSLNGLSILGGDSQVFNKAIANHRSPRCISRQFYKNILADSSKAEFNSLSHVFKDAQKSDSSQLNKNLLLSDKAEAFSRPKLMIYADDVTASHGSATGRAEDSELFYLRSRGLEPDFAQYLLAFGFAEEILEQIKIKSVREQLEDYVRGELKEMLESGLRKA